jgi:predicted metal-dependent hydrolase
MKPEKALPLFTRYNISVPSIRQMPTRWGSCTPKGKVILNPKLFKAPKGSVEYVIILELCHLVHHNHTRAFYKQQEIIMPEWKK